MKKNFMDLKIIERVIETVAYFLIPTWLLGFKFAFFIYLIDYFPFYKFITFIPFKILKATQVK